MPYYAKTRPSKRPARKAAVSTAVKSYIRRTMPKPEVKKNILSADEVALDTLSPQTNWQELTILNQGTQRNARTGNEVYFTGYDVRGVLCNNTSLPAFVRHLVIETADSVLSTNTLMELFDSAPGGTPTDLITSAGLNVIYSPVNTLKYKVHYDKVQKLGMITATGGEGVSYFKFGKKFRGRGLRVRYEGTASGEGNQDRRLLYLCMLGEGKDDSSGGATELSFVANVYHTDA